MNEWLNNQLTEIVAQQAQKHIPEIPEHPVKVLEYILQEKFSSFDASKLELGLSDN